MDWDGNTRSVNDCSRRYLCEADGVARYAAIMAKIGARIYEATYFKTFENVEKAGMKASLVLGPVGTQGGRLLTSWT